MNPNEYQTLASRTEPGYESNVRSTLKLANETNLELTHASFGIMSEAGEFADALKKHIIYDKPLDVTNLKEELGDLLWYIALAHSALGINMEDTMQANIAKLKVRYPGKFTTGHASERLDKKG